MTIVHLDRAGLARVGTLLDAGEAVVLPLPSPLPYAVVGRSIQSVNAAKGRAADQPCGVAVARFASVMPDLGLAPADVAFARWLMSDRLINLLLPINEPAAAWMAPSTRNGRLAMMLGWLPALRPVLDERHHLYLSSANRTGGSVARTAPAAQQELGTDAVVLDGDALRDRGGDSGSSAIIGVEPGSQLTLVRSGIQDADYDDPDRFLSDLRRAWNDVRDGA